MEEEIEFQKRNMVEALIAAKFRSQLTMFAYEKCLKENNNILEFMKCKSKIVKCYEFAENLANKAKI